MSREVDLRSGNLYHRSDFMLRESALGSDALDLQPAERGNYIQRALEAVQSSSSDALGLEPSQPADFGADPHVQETTSGAVAVYLQQQYKSIPIFQAAQTVSFSPDGRLEQALGNSVPLSDDFPISPRLTAAQAVVVGAKHIALADEDEQEATDQFGEPMHWSYVDVSHFMPTMVATFPDLPSMPTVLDKGPFADVIKASLIWFPLERGLRLGWEMIFTMPDYQDQYRVIVDSEDGTVLYSTQIAHHLTIRGNVYQVDGSQPRQLVDFPDALTSYNLPLPADLPDEFPDPWVTVDSASGNCVHAHLGAAGPTIRGTRQGDVVTFNPTNPVGDEQKVLNIFYYNCYMHDLFYLLGFRERDGNFQVNLFGRGGMGNDRVDARSHPAAVQGTANMLTPVDGTAPIMNMGLVTRTNRHTAFDASVVFHEFTHGVSNRLIGGPMNSHALESPQSRGMGEGISDYVACTVLGTTVVGSWVVNNPNGIRIHPYTSDYPGKYGMVGTPRYSQVHDLGEIWCATTLEMNRNLGARLGLQLMVDALKLSPANPSFLDMRDAILRAADHRFPSGQSEGGNTKRNRVVNGIWTAFAKFGMGFLARSNGASLFGVVEDFSLPPEAEGVDVEAAAFGADSLSLDAAGAGDTGAPANNGVSDTFWARATAGPVGVLPNVRLP